MKTIVGRAARIRSHHARVLGWITIGNGFLGTRFVLGLISLGNDDCHFSVLCSSVWPRPNNAGLVATLMRPWHKLVALRVDNLQGSVSPSKVL